MMRDTYPALPTVPASALVPVERQPVYVDAPDQVPAGGTAEAILRPPPAPSSRGDMVAIIHHEADRRYTFADLDRQSARLGNGLRALGVMPGERVAFRTGNRPEGIVAALGTWRVGGTVVPLPLQAPADDIQWFLNDTGATVLIAEGGPHLEAALKGVEGTDVERVIVVGEDPLPQGVCGWDSVLAGQRDTVTADVAPDSLALIWHTGGTTGTPKACYHTHRRFLAGGHSIGEATGAGPGEVWAAAAPIGHALGFIYHTIYSLLHGAAIVLVEDFANPTTMLAAIEAHGVGTFASVTMTWARMKEALEADPNLPVPAGLIRAYAMWQSASSTAVYDWWLAHGVELLNNFGSTAFATWVLVPQTPHPTTPGSLGRAAPGYEVLAIDPEAPGIHPVEVGTPGRMAVRGRTGLTYWNREEQQARDVRDGWTLVDDMIQFDEEGNATYLGRTDFLISTAGYKVAPVEVESVLSRHPAVREVAVIGTPDALRQEVVTAFVAVVDGQEPGDDLRRELQRMVKAELAPYKYPRRVEFIDALPRDHVGKVQQARLRDVELTSVATRQSPTTKER